MICEKVQYPSKRKAEQSAYAIKAKGYIAARKALYPYFCFTCNCYHLSKRK